MRDQCNFWAWDPLKRLNFLNTVIWYEEGEGRGGGSESPVSTDGGHVSDVLHASHRNGGPTVQSDSNFWIVVSICNLPYVKSLSWGVRQETEEQNDGERWWQSVWVDLPRKTRK